MDRRQQIRAGLALLDNPAGVNVFAKRAGRVINTHAHNLDALTDRIIVLGAWDVYACLNPAATLSGKPSVDNITEVRRFMVDIDPVEEGACLGDAVAAATNWIYDRLGSLVFTEIDSGRGRQLWIPVAPTRMVGDVAPIVRGIVRTLADDVGIVSGCRVDTTSGEVSRVARLPGTVNSKTAQVAHIIREETGYPIMLQGHRNFAQRGEAIPSNYARVEKDADQYKILAALEVWSREFILHGVHAAITSRHARGYATVANLREIGVGRDRAENMLLSGMSKCTPILNDPRWAERTMNLIYGSA